MLYAVIVSTALWIVFAVAYARAATWLRDHEEARRQDQAWMWAIRRKLRALHEMLVLAVAKTIEPGTEDHHALLDVMEMLSISETDARMLLRHVMEQHPHLIVETEAWRARRPDDCAESSSDWAP
jgi:hypothetical protein